MGFAKITQLKAKLAETMTKMKEAQLDAGIKNADVQLKALNTEKAALDKAITKELTGDAPKFVGDTVEFSKPSAEQQALQKAQDSEIKSSAPKYGE